MCSTHRSWDDVRVESESRTHTHLMHAAKTARQLKPHMRHTHTPNRLPLSPFARSPLPSPFVVMSPPQILALLFWRPGGTPREGEGGWFFARAIDCALCARCCLTSPRVCVLATSARPPLIGMQPLCANEIALFIGYGREKGFFV